MQRRSGRKIQWIDKSVAIIGNLYPEQTMSQQYQRRRRRHTMHLVYGHGKHQTPEQCITFDRKLGECWFAICRRCENIANRSPSTAAFCRYAHRRWTWHLSNEKQQAATTQRWPWCVCLTPKTVVATETPGTRYCMPQMVAANVPFLLFDAQHTAHGIPKMATSQNNWSSAINYSIFSTF